MDNRELLFGLNEMEGIGWKSIDRICKAGFLTNEVFSCSAEDWGKAGISGKMSAKLAADFDESWIRKRRSLMEESGAAMVTILDEDYPAQLKETAQPPWVLYYRGRLALASRPSVAMVGTRVPTAYGRKVGEMLAEELSAGGLTVVSGLARGIDSICHEAALAGPGSTIAVVATGLDKVYPPENRELERQIARAGLVISEYPLGTPSHPGLFPQRNRIIAGLSLGTVVVEADLRSGSLITADAALEAGRDVFAVPGPLTSPKSRGALELIKQGAKLVTGAADIMEEYVSYLPAKGLKESSADGLAGQSGDGQIEKKLTSEELHLYHILHQGPFSLDELLGSTRWDFGHLHSVLLSLIIKKAVTQLPGAIYKVI
ncbi:DNA-processing protein DprA [Paenibacillus sp. MMS20-IR301]|uniref:DNA-processing protein DprA n=1 Tax=Paenibacillus sp. MMS20-IR301 TaxID=2895946 RepID=UPI0028E4B4B2|nr:DNA-processing protein DprA [Paenibacillus sp. MMS20-IR301]WNS44778.1 DNA-processing protein DprA [Paenibacillus sp. MMS20-IR301]